MSSLLFWESPAILFNSHWHDAHGLIDLAPTWPTLRTPTNSSVQVQDCIELGERLVLAHDVKWVGFLTCEYLLHIHENFKAGLFHYEDILLLNFLVYIRVDSQGIL